MVAGSYTGGRCSALASTSLPLRSLREANGETEVDETNAQMSAIDRPKQPKRCQPKPVGDINCGGLWVCPLARNPTR